MLLPQSSAFAALKNRLNSVSAIGYLHSVPRTYVVSPVSTSFPTSRNSSVADVLSNFQIHQRQKSIPDSTHIQYSTPTTATPANYDRPNRLKGRDDGIRWTELLEKFRVVQEKARRIQRGDQFDDGPGWADARAAEGDAKVSKDLTRLPGPPLLGKDMGGSGGQAFVQKPKGLGGKFGRLSGGRPKR